MVGHSTVRYYGVTAQLRVLYFDRHALSTNETVH